MISFQVKPMHIHSTSILGIVSTLLLAAMYDLHFSPEIRVVNSGEAEADRITPGFLVHSAKCSIPDMDPHHPTILRFLKKEEEISCSLAPPLTTVERTTLLYHEEHAGANIEAFLRTQGGEEKTLQELESEIGVNRNDTVSCCYRAVRRVTQPPTEYDNNCDKQYKIRVKCKPITENETLIFQEGILVVCNAKEHIIYKNLHILIQRELLLERRMTNTVYFNDFMISDRTASHKNSEQNTPENLRPSPNEDPDGQKDSVTVSYDKANPLPLEERLNVIMFLTDAVSRLNFYRHMPKTNEFLTRLGAIDLAGFNKVGDNTYPNVLALLTGIRWDEMDNHTCYNQRDIRVFDDCPFAWKEYRRNGYVTGFMEDSPWMSTFNYLLPGFRVQPTEFFGRPFFLASEEEIGRMRILNSNFCQGSKMSMTVVHEGVINMAKAFPDVPFFGLYTTSSVTHDVLTFAQHADLPTLKFLEELEDTGILNKTVLVFFSDHGMRWGDIRSTFVGMMEERLPYVFLLFPSWFRDRYPKAHDNMRANTRRLTANFDVHVMLRDIAFGHYTNEAYVTSTPIPSRGISLFQSIPKNRSCEDAGIPDHYCTCHNVKPLPSDDNVAIRGAEFLMGSLNRDLQNYTLCVQFTKVTILNAGISEFGEALKPSDSSTEMRTYVLQVRLAPGGVEVEASLRSNPVEESFEIAGGISRINAYGKQSHCIFNPFMGKYCYCRDLLRNE